MGKNNLCFCGSGKKTKKCHPDINEHSLIANTLSIYADIDNTLKNYNVTNNIVLPCKCGCSDCCYDYFYITQTEYFCILQYIESHNLDFDYNELFKLSNEYIQELKNVNISEYNKLHTRTTSVNNKNNNKSTIFLCDDSKVQRFSKPCIFLKDNKCSIYPVRPLICRWHGYISEADNCSKFKDVEKRHYNLLSLDVFGEKITKNFEIFDCKGIKIFKRPYPLAYFFYRYFPHFITKTDKSYSVARDETLNQYLCRLESMNCKK